jgi:hypothetical protein
MNLQRTNRCGDQVTLIGKDDTGYCIEIESDNGLASFTVTEWFDAIRLYNILGDITNFDAED